MQLLNCLMTVPACRHVHRYTQQPMLGGALLDFFQVFHQAPS